MNLRFHARTSDAGMIFEGNLTGLKLNEVFGFLLRLSSLNKST